MPSLTVIDPAPSRGLLVPVTVAALLAVAAWQLISVPARATASRRPAATAVAVPTPAGQELRIGRAENVAKPPAAGARR